MVRGRLQRICTCPPKGPFPVGFAQLIVHNREIAVTMGGALRGSRRKSIVKCKPKSRYIFHDPSSQNLVCIRQRSLLKKFSWCPVLSFTFYISNRSSLVTRRARALSYLHLNLNAAATSDRIPQQLHVKELSSTKSLAKQPNPGLQWKSLSHQRCSLSMLPLVCRLRMALEGGEKVPSHSEALNMILSNKPRRSCFGLSKNVMVRAKSKSPPPSETNRFFRL